MRIEAVTLMLSFNFQLWLGVKPGLKCFHFAEIREQVLLAIIIIIIIIFNFKTVTIIIIIIIITIHISWRQSEVLPRVRSLPRNQRRTLPRASTPSWLIRRKSLRGHWPVGAIP